MSDELHYDPSDPLARAVRVRILDALLPLARIFDVGLPGEVVSAETDRFNRRVSDLAHHAQSNPFVGVMVLLEALLAANRAASVLAVTTGRGAEETVRRLFDLPELE